VVTKQEETKRIKVSTMKMNWNRRDFLKAGGLTALAMGMNFFSPEIFKRRILAGPAVGQKKLIFVFQRGGSDGVNTLIPSGDPAYNLANRPTLFIDEADAIDLGNGFASLHPAMQPMMEIYNNAALTGVPGPGNLAILHRVGYSGQSQSHFDSQQYWENGTTTQPYFEEGMFYRHVARTMDPVNNHFVAAALTSNQMVALKGPLPVPTIADPRTFSFAGSASKVQKFLGNLPSSPVGPDGKGMLGFYGGPKDFAAKLNRDLVYGTGVALADAISIVQDALALGPYTPENGAVYPGGGFGQRLQQVAMLFKRTPLRIAGVNIGGWDTHTNQGGATGGHANLLGDLAEGYQALYRDLQDQWEDVIIVSMTEFGRTSLENGSFGTDHAYGCVVFVAGGGVNGGVYNCSASAGKGAIWVPGVAGPAGPSPVGDLFSQNSRYVRRKTDYRAVFGEIFMRHFGDDLATVNYVIPGYDAAKTANPADFTFLNFLPA
jgi:uncharacterized protein (DUF1501 family)